MINKEIKEICLKCEHNIHCQNKGCAFRSLGNEYCDEVENANNLIKDLQQKIEKAIEFVNEFIEEKYFDDREEYFNIFTWNTTKDDLLEILGGKE